MAAVQLPVLLLILSIATLLFSPSNSLTCTSQTITGGPTPFANCIDLPTQNATLHYTYDNSSFETASLSIAFLARPASPSGWVAWGINPSAPIMLGTQALLAYKKSDGSISDVLTFNLKSTEKVVPSNISYKVFDVSTRNADGMIGILATLAISQNTTSVNYAWNVGESVSKNGVPSPHGLGPNNIGSVGTIEFTQSTGGNGTASGGNGTSGAVAPPSPTTGHSGGGGRIESGGFGLFVPAALVMANFVIWS